MLNSWPLDPARGIHRPMRRNVWGLAAGMFVGTCSLSFTAHAWNPLVVVPSNASETPAVRYAGMDASACLQELKTRDIPFTFAAAVEGVDAPVRISGPLHGVVFIQRDRSSDESLNADSSILDCRLVLALDDFSEQLARKGISEVGFISAYRYEPEVGALPGQRHPAGLAMDVAWMRKANGSYLRVERDFDGRIGAKTCGPRADPPRRATESARDLRSIVCDAAAQRIFNVVLTPNYDRSHRNHVHFEVRRSIQWFLAQ